MENQNLEGARQDLASRLVQREVVCCVSSLMSGLLQLSNLVSYRDMQDALCTDSDELLELCEWQDYEEAARQFIMDDADVTQLEEVAEQHGYWSDVLADAKVPEVWADEPDEDGSVLWGIKGGVAEYADEEDAEAAALDSVLSTIRQCVWELVTTNEEFRWVCNEYLLDPERNEVYEHWVVNDWLARKLAEKGEITGEVCGLTIWGRGCTGQSISMDGVIRDITQELWPEEWAGEKVL